MTHKIVLCAALAAGLAFALPAQGQAPLPAHEITTILHSTGLTPVGRPVLRGSTYVVGAIDTYGQDVRVVVDAQRGRILSVRPVVPVAAPYQAPVQRYPGPPYGEPGYVPDPFYPGPGPDDDEYEVEPPPGPPPRVIYAPRDTSALPRSAPQRTSAAAKPAASSVAAAKSAPVPKTAAEVSPETAASAAPADPTSTGSVPAKPEASPAVSSPPVQTFE